MNCTNVEIGKFSVMYLHASSLALRTCTLVSFRPGFLLSIRYNTCEVASAAVSPCIVEWKLCTAERRFFQLLSPRPVKGLKIE